MTVIAVNDNNPVFTSSNTANVAENTTAVLTVNATDADSPAQTVTYSISGGADSGKFAINSSTGALTFQDAPDYETPTDADTDNVYEVQVTADDGNGGTNVAVNQRHGHFGQRQQSRCCTSPSTANVAENTMTVMTVNATDADLPAQTVTYSITGGVDQAKFSINATTGELTFQAAPDYETPTDADANNVYEVQVTADDGNGGTTSQSISVTVTPANDNNPVFNVGQYGERGGEHDGGADGECHGCGQPSADGDVFDHRRSG